MQPDGPSQWEIFRISIEPVEESDNSPALLPLLSGKMTKGTLPPRATPSLFT